MAQNKRGTRLFLLVWFVKNKFESETEIKKIKKLQFFECAKLQIPAGSHPHYVLILSHTVR